MTETPDQPLSDDDISTEFPPQTEPMPGGDADGTDGDSTDGTDGDSTDGGDADGTDGDGTDGSAL
jgi:hypothetical protein